MSKEKMLYGLPESEFNQAKEAMRIAYKPQDENGNALSEEELRERDYKAYYPTVTPVAEGPYSPMLYAEDFANGQVPEGFHYELGQMEPCGMYNGMALGTVVYNNPIYNMRLEQYCQCLQVIQYLEEQKKKEKEKEAAGEKTAELVQEQPSLSVQIYRGDVPVSPVLREPRAPAVVMGDLQPYEYGNGMYVKFPDGDSSISNFTVRVLEHRRVYTRPEVFNEEYRIEVVCQGRRQPLIVPAGSMSVVLKNIQKEMPACTIVSNVKSANKLIENAIRQQTLYTETVDVIRCNGFIRIRGFWFYVHDKAVSPISGVIFETGHSISYINGVGAKQALMNAFLFLQISQKQEVIAPLFLVAHLGTLFELFKEAGCLVRFVTALVGPSGSLKTALTTCLYRLFDEQRNEPVASFLDTVAGLELDIAKTIGRVQIIDDLRPPVTSSESAAIAKKLEEILRIFGDGNSKRRSSPSLQQRQTPAPACCGVITGEDIYGSNSSLLRCLIIRIDKGDFDGAKLQVFQKTPQILQTHMYHFLNYCGKEGDAIIRYIREEFPRQRALFNQHIHEPRLVDTAATLQVMAQILLTYAGSIGAFSAEVLADLRTSFWNAILTAVAFSEVSSREMNPAAMYLRAVFDLVQSGSILLAPSAEAYRPTEHIGYIRDGSWWLRKHEIYPKVTQYWHRFGVTFPLRERNVLSMLANNGIIATDYETVDGKPKKLYSRKSAAEGHPRMLVIHIEPAQEYLRQELGEF